MNKTERNFVDRAFEIEELVLALINEVKACPDVNPEAKWDFVYTLSVASNALGGSDFLFLN
jgi:hypothetical protein